MLSGNICCVTVIQLGIFFFNLGMQINGMGKKMSRFLAEARVLPLILVGASRIDGKSG